jgi:hypothetical protein
MISTLRRRLARLEGNHGEGGGCPCHAMVDAAFLVDEGEEPPRCERCGRPACVQVVVEVVVEAD